MVSLKDHSPYSRGFHDLRSCPNYAITEPRFVNFNNLVALSLETQQHQATTPKVQFSMWNARSVTRKSVLLCDIIQSNKLNILAVTETWINSDINNSQIPELLNNLQDFKILQVPWVSAKGAGLGFFLRKAFNSLILNDFNPKSFELIDMLMRLKYFTCRVILLIYRPPPSRKNKLTTNMFLDEFAQLIESVVITDTHVLYCGDSIYTSMISTTLMQLDFSIFLIRLIYVNTLQVLRINVVILLTC